VNDAHLVEAFGAVFSADRKYRYALWRTWDPGLARVLFVGLNPSTADACSDDPTLRRCIGFARDWGYGGILVGNLFGRCATRPAELRTVADPVGEDNAAWLERLAREAARLIACWGNHGAFMDRDRHFSAGRGALYCLRLNRNGSPAHPLYLRRGQLPRRWSPPAG
jgi:hypothetical protein